jgi:type I restriction enzyme, S subunit
MSTVPAGCKQTEVGVIPEDWRVSTVGREFEIKLGKMLDSEKNVGVPKPYLGNKAVQWDRIDISDLPTVPMSPSDIDRFRLRKGDLLACEGGEVGRAAIWDAPIEECYYQKALHRLRPLRGFDSQLMAALLRHWSDSGLLINFVTQTSIAHLPREKFLEVPMPVPPAPEQRAIATALSDVDALLAKLDQFIAKKRDLKQAAMQQLLTGQTRLPGFSGGWEVKRLGNVANFLKGKGLPKSSLIPFGSEPCIHYGELFTRYPETIGTIISHTNDSRGTFRSIANDVLMPTSDVTPRGLAKASCVTVDNVILGGDILVIRTDRKRMCGTFLSYVIRREEDQVLQLVTGSTVFHLYGSDMKKFTFSMPPLPEQTAIATVLSDMDAELAALEARRDKTCALKQGMMQELLTGRIRLVKPEKADV